MRITSELIRLDTRQVDRNTSQLFYGLNYMYLEDIHVYNDREMIDDKAKSMVI